MRKPFASFAVAALLAVAAVPASAKSDKKGPVLRYASTYAAALEEARDRGTVIFATFHIDH